MMHLDHLPNQKKDERVHIFLRRHWITPLQIILVITLMFVVPIVLVVIFRSDLGKYLNDPSVGPLLILIASIYSMSVWLFAFMEFTDYYLDVWIVTNKRIINIEQKGLFSRIASELNLDAVQDVTSEVKGMLHTFLDYGSVHIQTAGERVRFLFKDVSVPEKIKEQILQLVEADKKLRQQEEAKIQVKAEAEHEKEQLAEKNGSHQNA